MLRMTLPLVLLAFISGCHWSDVTTNRVSLVTARVETLGPNWHGFSSCGSECSDCIPHRPYTSEYKSCWDNYITEHTAHRCAYRGLHAYRQQCGRQISHHFKMGFIAAYEDLAMNRRPSPPIIPPPKYWNAYYRSCAGQPLVEEWFAGYDAGRAMGLESGVSRFHEIYIRRNGCGAGPTCGGDYSQPDQYADQYAEQYPVAQQPQPTAAPGMPYAGPSLYSPQPTNAYSAPGSYGPQGSYGGWMPQQ